MANDKQARKFFALDFGYLASKEVLILRVSPLTFFCLILGRPLSVSVAYSGRIAVAFKNGKSFKGKSLKSEFRDEPNEDGDTRYFDLVVSIFECESTGGIFGVTTLI